MSKKFIKKTNKTQNLEIDVKEKELEYQAIKEALEKGNIELLSNLHLNNIKSTKMSTKIPKKLSEKEKERRDEIRRLKEAEDLAQIQQKLFRQIKGKKKIEPLSKKSIYANKDVFGANIEKECEKVFPKEEKSQKYELLRSENVLIKNNNISHNNNEKNNIIDKKSIGLGKKFKINCENINEIDEIKDKEYLEKLDKEIRNFYIEKCGRIFNFLKDIYLCRYIDEFLKQGYDIYEDFLEIPEDFFQQMNIPFLNKSQQQKFYNKLHLIQSKYKTKYLKNNGLINQKENKMNYKNFNFSNNNDNIINNITNSHNNTSNNFNHNLLLKDNKSEKKNIDKKILKDTSPFITQEDLMYRTINDIDELEKQRSEEFKKEVEKWRNNNSSRPNTSHNPTNNKLTSEVGINININAQGKNKNMNNLYCWNCYKKFLKGEGISKEYNNNYDLNSKYNMKNFCSLKCKKDYEKKQRSQNMCFECRKMFDIMEGFIAFEGEKFCSNECKNKFINEEKGNFKNKKQNKKKIIKKENNDAPEKNEDEEEEDIYDPMDDF
jgi:hypothetical protein